MKKQQGVFAKQAVKILLKSFFALVKMTFILLILIVGTLIASQSSVSPVSVRLLTSYAMEYAVNTFKPVRPYFPAPYVVEVETH